MKNIYYVCGDEVFIKLPKTDDSFRWTVINLEDFDKINRYSGFWRFYGESDYVYASLRLPNRNLTIHEVLLGYDRSKETLVGDHINKDTLDNRRNNLRLTSQHGNAFNSKLDGHNTSGIAGVSFNNRDRRWYAKININGRRIHLGCFNNKTDAIEARSKAEDAYIL